MTLPGRGSVDGTPKRVRVTSPRRQARTPDPLRSPRAEIEEETGLGEVYVDALVGAQRRLSVSVLAGLFVVVGALPAVFILFPVVHRITLGGIPLPWIIMLGLVYPFALFLARGYVRSAERVERDFTDLVRHQ